ncbi:MAG: phospholipase D-like domain-containing protein [Planctomycetota bacterium]
MRLPLLALCALLALPVAAQDTVRPVLEGEGATIVFSPEGGYAPQNYLKQYKKDGQPAWATMNGALAELIRRAPRGSGVRIGSFKLSDQEVLDACFWAAEHRNVEVKLWLKGPPGLDYVVPGHEAIAARADEYLRRRAQLKKEQEWGDFQVQIGTAAKMAAFGKVNDMHQKFGIVGLDPVHGPGKNSAFLGTSNIGSSSDSYHNENRVFFLENPQVTQRLWQEFERLWRHLGEGRTHQGGDASQPTNITPEPTPRIKLAGGGYADEPQDAALQLRFTYEQVNGSFHRISDDFVAAFGEARYLKPGDTVWVAQFGFAIDRIGRAILEAARQNPEVQFKVMVHMAEADSWVLKSLLQAGLPNVHAWVKWDSHKLKLSKGSRPSVPGPTDPGPALLHHKTAVIGPRLMITGSYNFFGDADDQGEDIVIVRAHRDARYAHLLADTYAEFEAMVRSGVLLDASLLFGKDGLFEKVGDYSKRPGFLELISRLPESFTSEADLLQRLQGSGAAELAALDAATLHDDLGVLERFAFAERDASDRVRRRPDPDLAAHTGKPDARAKAKQPAEPTAAQVLEGEVLADGSLRATGGDYALPAAQAAALAPYAGRRARVKAVVAGSELREVEVLSPREGDLSGTVRADAGRRLQTGAREVELLGSLARALDKVSGKEATVRGMVFSDAAGDPEAIEVLAIAAKATRDARIYLDYQDTGRKAKKGDALWVTSASSWSKWVKVIHGDHEGYVYLTNLSLSTSAGIIGELSQD